MLMFSAPPARTNSAWPSWISCAPRRIACRPEPHSRLIVSAGTSFGTPDLSPMWRAKYTASPDVWRTLPKMTWSICFGSTLDFSSAPFAAMTPRSVADVPRYGLVVAFATYFLFVSWRWFRRRGEFAIALAFFGGCLFAFKDLPAQTADLVAPLEEEPIVFSGWGPHTQSSRLLRLANG